MYTANETKRPCGFDDVTYCAIAGERVVASDTEPGARGPSVARAVVGGHVPV